MDASLNARLVLPTKAEAPGLAGAWPLWLLGAFVAVGYGASAPHEGDFWWFDAARHAMNSVFVHDFFADGGWRDPVTYARAYYTRYPGINIGFYPPFLYVVTAPALGLLGVSHAICQAVVALFAAATAMGAYMFVRRSLGRSGAFALGSIVVLAPEMLLWGRQVQLDVPTVALLVWGTWALARYLEAPAPRWLLLGSVLLGCAMLTRVQAIFAWPLWLFALFLHPAGRTQPWRGRLLATMLYAMLALPAIVSALYFSSVVGNLAVAMADMPKLNSWWNWGWYAAQLSKQLGAAGLTVLLLGLATALLRSPDTWQAAWRGRIGVAIAMGLLAWLFFSGVSNKEPRFGLPILPFLLIAAGMMLGRWPAIGRLAPAVLPTMALWAALEAATAGRWSDVPRVTGHREAALLAARLAPPDTRVLVSAHRDGNFIFAMRVDGHRPDLAIQRADKLLVEMKIMRQLGIRDRGLDEKDIRTMLENERVGVVVAQTDYLADQPSMQALRRLLASGCCFVLVKTIAINGRHRPDETELRVYVRR